MRPASSALPYEDESHLQLLNTVSENHIRVVKIPLQCRACKNTQWLVFSSREAREYVAKHLSVGGVQGYEVVDANGRVVLCWFREDGKPSPIRATEGWRTGELEGKPQWNSY